LQRHFQDMTAREAQLGARVEGWKHQWSKINPALDALNKDAAQQRQQTEHQDHLIHGLQTAYATTFQNFEALQSAQREDRGELKALNESNTSVLRGLEETREDLGKATSFSNNLHTALERTNGELGLASRRLLSIEGAHGRLNENYERTKGHVGDLLSHHRNTAANMQVIQEDLHRTNDTLSTTRQQLEAAGANLNNIRGDLGRTNENVRRLDHGLEMCNSTFTGLQRGFVETGTHMSSRPITLPRLPAKSPRHRQIDNSGMPTARWSQDMSTAASD